MTDKFEVIQKSTPLSNTTQIGVQYIGMTPEQASKQTIDLFMDNFPKLQSLAKETAEIRATEMCNDILKKLEDKQINNLNPFTQPDVQYVLYEAQKNHARFGERESMDIVTELIVNRIQNDDTRNFKRILDNAILIASELSPIQLDCLSGLFLTTSVSYNNIKTIEDLSNLFKNISSIFNLESVMYRQEISYLNFKGCLYLNLKDVASIQSQQYNFSKDEVNAIMTKGIKQFTGDYGITEIGILLAIVNAEKKSKYRFDPHIWIRD